jgi:hypothetical protein
MQHDGLSRVTLPLRAALGVFPTTPTAGILCAASGVEECEMTNELTKTISPGQHAVLDYGVAAAFLAYGFKVRSRNRAASTLAFINGAAVLGMSLMTDYPGGVFRTLSFRTHRTGDIAQAALAGIGPVLLGFGNEPEAKYFYGQAASEVGVIAATDWDATA